MQHKTNESDLSRRAIGRAIAQAGQNAKSILQMITIRRSTRPIIGPGSWWEPERPDTKSLRLLPSGPDRVGDGIVRPTPARHMAAHAPKRKLGRVRPGNARKTSCRRRRPSHRPIPARCGSMSRLYNPGPARSFIAPDVLSLRDPPAGAAAFLASASAKLTVPACSGFPPACGR